MIMSASCPPRRSAFWTTGELKVEDNWWKGTDCHNVPLDVWYDTLVKAVKAGSTTAIGGDVSEPGYDGDQKAAVVPTFDIPPASIGQDARECRLDNGSTSDDHGVHLVGWTSVGGVDWFLIKDSARAARKAPARGLPILPRRLCEAQDDDLYRPQGLLQRRAGEVSWKAVSRGE